MEIKNNGGKTAYVPTDGPTVALEPGETVDVRLGNAVYAARNIAGVELVETPAGIEHGVAEASTEVAVAPIAEHVSEDPTDTRYAVVGDVPGTTDVTVIPGAESDHVAPVDVETTGEAAPGEFDLDTATGAQIDAELKSVGLPTDGKVEERRTRLREYLESAGA